jgi:hypothetical protein
VVSALGSAVRRPISWTVFIACLLSETVGLVPRELLPARPGRLCRELRGCPHP